MMNSRVNVTRHLAYGILRIPPKLSCIYCKPSIMKRLLNPGKAVKTIKKCTKPFSIKWANHREVETVKVYKEINDYLNNAIVEDDEVVNDDN